MKDVADMTEQEVRDKLKWLIECVGYGELQAMHNRNSVLINEYRWLIDQIKK